MAEDKKPTFSVEYLGKANNIPPFGITLEGLTLDQTKTVVARFTELFPGIPFEPRPDEKGGHEFHAAVPSGRDVMKLLQALETKTVPVEGKEGATTLVPDMNFDKPNRIRDEIARAEKQYLEAEVQYLKDHAPQFDLKADKEGIHATITKLPAAGEQTVLDALVKIPGKEKPEVRFTHGEQKAEITFEKFDQVKHFLKNIERRLSFAESPHVLAAKVDKVKAASASIEQGL